MDATPATPDFRPPARLGARVVLGVSVAWVVVGVIMGAQTSLGAVLSGAPPSPASEAVIGALVQTLPWIPVTVAVIALTMRFPLGRTRWRQHGVVHLVSAVLLAFAANVMVVLGYWITTGQFQGLEVLARQGALWTTLRLHIALLIYAAVLGITEAALYYHRTQDSELRLARMEGQLARARLQALNAQMRPHFLFNTLHAIGQLWRSGQSDEAEAALDHLGGLFHKVHKSTMKFEVPLREELDMVREYLAIESARFRDRLRASVRAEDDVLERMVPPLILQPLVENAIRHGVSAASTAGRVDVTADLAGGVLRLRVRDDGPGMEAVAREPGSGTGLRNTRERLAQLYGNRGGLAIESSAQSGTTVTVTIAPAPV